MMNLNKDFLDPDLGIKYHCYGEFECANCFRTWSSNVAWKYFGQKCRSCSIIRKPAGDSLEPLFYYDCLPCEKVWKSKEISEGIICKFCKQYIKPQSYQEYWNPWNEARTIFENLDDFDKHDPHEDALCEKCDKLKRLCKTNKPLFYYVCEPCKKVWTRTNINRTFAGMACEGCKIVIQPRSRWEYRIFLREIQIKLLSSKRPPVHEAVVKGAFGNQDLRAFDPPTVPPAATNALKSQDYGKLEPSGPVNTASPKATSQDKTFAPSAFEPTAVNASTFKSQDYRTLAKSPTVAINASSPETKWKDETFSPSALNTLPVAVCVSVSIPKSQDYRTFANSVPAAVNASEEKSQDRSFAPSAVQPLLEVSRSMLEDNKTEASPAASSSRSNSQLDSCSSSPCSSFPAFPSTSKPKKDYKTFHKLI